MPHNLPDYQTTSRHYTTTTENRNSRHLSECIARRRRDRRQAREDAGVNPNDSSSVRVETSALAKALSETLVAIRHQHKIILRLRSSQDENRWLLLTHP